MDYFIPLIAEQTRDLMGEEYPFARLYAADDQNLPAILDELYAVALDYARARGEIPVRVNIRQYVPEFENGEALLYSLYSLDREGYVCVKLLQISTKEEIKLDELPCGSGKFGPVFHGDWNLFIRMSITAKISSRYMSGSSWGQTRLSGLTQIFLTEDRCRCTNPGKR